jgi:hypothetical protein
MDKTTVARLVCCLALVSFQSAAMGDDSGEILLLKARIATLERENKELKSRLAAASSPASAPTHPSPATQPVGPGQAQQAARALAQKKFQAIKGNAWLESLAVGTVGRVASQQGTVVKVLGPTEAVITIGLVEEYVSPSAAGSGRFITAVPTRTRFVPATILMTGMPTAEWADDAVVPIEAPLWIFAIQERQGRRYLTAEPLDRPPPTKLKPSARPRADR